MVVTSGSADVTLTVLRKGKIVATVRRTFASAGFRQITWNGKVRAAPAPRAGYVVRVRAVTASGATARAATSLRVR